MRDEEAALRDGPAPFTRVEAYRFANSREADANAFLVD